MADQAPSLFSFLKSQVQRKSTGDGGETPGRGGGFRLSPGLWVAVILAIAVVVIVLTSDGGGTPSNNAADSASPGASSPPSEAAPGSAPPEQQQQADRTPDSPGPDASPNQSPAGKTAFTRHRTALIVRSEPTNNSEVVARLGYDNAVTLVCHTTGPATYGFQGKSSTLWDKITTPGGNVGYVPDVWVLTEAEVPQLVGPC